MTEDTSYLVKARDDLDAARAALAQAERERDALASNVADLTASLRMAQDTLRQREAAQRAAEDRGLNMGDLESGEVNHPPHYNQGKIEVIDFIQDQQLNFALGSAVKYITRAAHKGDRLQDLEKARWYIQDEIYRLKYPGLTSKQAQQADVIAPRRRR